MNEDVGLLPMGMWTRLRRWWERYGAEAGCARLIYRWEKYNPENIEKIERWIENDEIPDDEDLQTLCKVYRDLRLPE